MTGNKPTQQLFDFDRPDAPQPPPAQPGEEVLAALDRLAGWLTDPLTNKPVSDLGGEALSAVRKALVERKNGYVHRAEDLLEALLLRNGKTGGDDIAAGQEGDDFHHVVDKLLDALAERVTTRRR
jgi:hypothetical protein